MPRKTITLPPPFYPDGPGFNEAAARCRGKPQDTHRTTLAAEPGFNEAAARCRGKPRRVTRPPAGGRRFNEAAARCRGKPRAILTGAPPPIWLQ